MRLLILRHAKSDRPPSVGDFDRPLSGRGRRAAPRVGSWLSAHAAEPALVLCSPARRAKETLALILPMLKHRPEIRYDPALYLAEVETLLREIRAVAPVSPLMLVGHNPGLQDLGMTLLARRQTGEAKKQAEEFVLKFPTAGLAVLDFRRRDWKGLRPATGILAGFMRPKSLIATPGEE